MDWSGINGIVNTSVNRSIINLLCQKAHSSLMEQKIAAIMIKNNKAVSSPYCNIHRYISNAVPEKNILSIHAEINLINHHPNKNKVSLVVIRLNSNNQLCNARPCYNCLLELKKYGIKKVFYSININKIICERVHHMLSVHISVGRRVFENYEYENNEYYAKKIQEIIPKEVKFESLIALYEYSLQYLCPLISIVFEQGKINSARIVYNNTILLIVNLI